MELFCQELLIDRPPKSRPLLLSRPAIIGLRKVSLSLVPLLVENSFFPRRKGISEKPRNSTRNIFFPAEQKQEKSWPHTHLEWQERENAFIRLLILKYVDGRKRKEGSHSPEKVFSPPSVSFFTTAPSLQILASDFSPRSLHADIAHTKGKKSLAGGARGKSLWIRHRFLSAAVPINFPPLKRPSLNQ